MGNIKATGRKMVWRILFIICFALLFTILLHHAAYASGWIDGADSSIYDGGMTGEKKNAVEEVLFYIWNTIKTLAGDLLSSMFSDMIRSMGDGLYYMLSMAGIDMNAIVYGRVGGAAFFNDGVALFTYELVPGNPYGIVSMQMYGALRMLFVLGIICVLMARLAAFLYGSGGGKQREQLKETTTYSVILLLTVVLMPYMLGVILFLRDVVLYVVMVRGGELIEKVSDTIYPGFRSIITFNVNRIGPDIMYAFYGSAGEFNLITMFREAAGGNMVNSLMYIGAVALTLYFAFSYASVAMSQVVMVVSFPIACVVSLFDRSVMKGWLKQMVGTLIIPILDSFLMLIPVFFGLLGKSQSVSGYTILQFILCSCIIPARGYVRMWLGFGGPSSMELAGIGALMGALQLGKAVAGAAISLGTGHLAAGAAAALDESMGDFFSERQGIKDLEEVNTMDKLNQDVDDLFGQTKQGGNEAGAFAGRANHSFERGADAAEGSRGMGSQAELKEKIGELEKRRAILTDHMKRNDVRSAEIGRQTAVLDEDIASLKADRAAAHSMGEEGKGRVEECDRLITENELAKKHLALEASDIKKENAIKSGQAARIDAVSKRAREAMAGMRAAGGGGAGISEGEQAILDKYANIENFETPEFKNISLERKAELYRERAMTTRRRARMQTALGTVGAVAGATTGIGATMFGSPATKLYGTAIGIQAGSGIGALVEETVHNRQATAAYHHSQPENVLTGEGVPSGSRMRMTDKRTPQARITQKENARQQVLIDRQMEVTTEYTEGATYERRREFQDFGDEKHQWVFGGPASDERIWNQMVSTPERYERMEAEVRRALTTTSANVRIMRQNLDGDFDKGAREKNQEIMENAMETFAAEFSFNMLNSGVIPEESIYEGFDAESYMQFIEAKVRSQAPEVLREKLKSMGLLY